MPDEAADFANCGVCGRTILRGERTDDYVNGQGEHVRVCLLCRTRAESAGMVPATLAATLERPERRRGLRLRRRLTQAAGRARHASGSLSVRIERKPAEHDEGEAEEPARPRPAAPRRAAENGDSRRAAEARPERPAPPVEQPQPQRRREPLTRERLMRHALHTFNRSHERRKVAGLMRSLGTPSAGVRVAERHRAVLTVAWELSWYQWEVSLEGSQNGSTIREIGKGDEVGELAENAQSWNASVSEDGELALALTTAAPGQAAEAG